MKNLTYLHTIKSAEKLFNRFGFSKTAVTDVASAAEVSRATIFNNFGNKDGLLRAVLENKKNEYKAEISRRMDKKPTVYGKVRIMFSERIRLLSDLKFISEDAIAVENSTVEDFMEDFNTFFRKSISGILRSLDRGTEEINSMINTMLFMIKGIEQGLNGGKEGLSINQVEDDIEFFLRQMLPEEGTKGTV